jgi:uncharacterized protein
MVPIPAFHVMAKPTGARCNLRCDYCFYQKKYLYPHSSFLMTNDILERYLRQTIRAHRVPEITIAWQGGEPTLMGVDFFRHAVALEKRFGAPGLFIQNTLQTNGTLIDEEWCRFLSENKFLVGLSIDGPKHLHDIYRKNRMGESVFDKVVKAARLLHRYNVDFNLLCTINAANENHPLEVYRFLRDELEARYLQFIPIVERDTRLDNQCKVEVSNQSVHPEAFGEFLIAIFDEWVSRDVGTMFVQFFDGVLASYVRGHSSLCVLQPSCGTCVALEHNGDVYSCDHFVNPDHLLGNIQQTSIDMLVNSEKQHEFARAKTHGLPGCCQECEFLFTCYGECPKNRLFDSPDGSGRVNWLCPGLKHFFSHTKDKMGTMAALLRSGRTASEVMHINRSGTKSDYDIESSDLG